MGASSSGGGSGGNNRSSANNIPPSRRKYAAPGTLSDPREKDDTAAKMDLFYERGATKIKEGAKTPSIAVNVATSVLSGPLQAGSRVNRKFFTDKVLGSKNYKGTTKDDFQKLSATAQEKMYTDYMSGRTSGRTDAYGNPISSGGDNNNQPAQPVIVKKNIGGTEVQTTEAKLAEEKEEAEEYDVRKTKRRGRRQTILTSQSGARGNLVLGKPTLLGA